MEIQNQANKTDPKIKSSENNQKSLARFNQTEFRIRLQIEQVTCIQTKTVAVKVHKVKLN